MARKPYTGQMTSAFGPRKAPTKGASTFHQGEDGVGGYNTAPEGGTVMQCSYAGGWGNRIVFQGDSGTVHYLAHNAPGGFLVPVGRYVDEGTNLGIKGMTGTATGVHVHWETRPKNGSPIDPSIWLGSQGGTSGGGGTPITSRRKSMATVYRRGSSSNAMFALGGDSPNTKANWITTRNATLWQGWVAAHGPYIMLSEADYDLFAGLYQASTIPGGGAVSVGDVTVDSSAVVESIRELIAAVKAQPAPLTASQVATAVNVDAAARLAQ